MIRFLTELFAFNIRSNIDDMDTIIKYPNFFKIPLIQSLLFISLFIKDLIIPVIKSSVIKTNNALKAKSILPKVNCMIDANRLVTMEIKTFILYLL